MAYTKTKSGTRTESTWPTLYSPVCVGLYSFHMDGRCETSWSTSRYNLTYLSQRMRWLFHPLLRRNSIFNQSHTKPLNARWSSQSDGSRFLKTLTFPYSRSIDIRGQAVITGISTCPSLAPSLPSVDSCVDFHQSLCYVGTPRAAVAYIWVTTIC